MRKQVILVALTLMLVSVVAAQEFSRNMSGIATAGGMYLPAGFNPNSSVSFYLYNDMNEAIFLMVNGPDGDNFPIGIGPCGVARVRIAPSSEEKIQPFYAFWEECGDLCLALNAPAEVLNPARSQVLFLSNPTQWPHELSAEDGYILEDHGRGWAYYAHTMAWCLVGAMADIRVPLHMEQLLPIGNTLRATRAIKAGYVLVAEDKRVTVINDYQNPRGNYPFDIGARMPDGGGEWESVFFGEKKMLFLKKGLYVASLADGCVWEFNRR